MPSSGVRTFDDPREYGTAIRATDAKVTPTSRGRFAAKLVRIDLHDLWMQRFSENLPRIVHTAAGNVRTGIAFRVQPGHSLRWHRTEMQPTSIIRISEAHDAFQRSSGAAVFGAMSVPREKMVSMSVAIAGCDLSPPRDDLSVTPSPDAIAKLLQLHADAGALAEVGAEIIAHPAAARGVSVAEPALSLTASPTNARSAKMRRRFVLSDALPKLDSTVGVAR